MASKGSAADKAAVARKTAAALRAKQRAASRRNTIVAAVGALVIVAVFAVIVSFIVKAEKDDSGPYGVYDSGEMKVPTAADGSGGIIVGPGGVGRGSVAADAVRVDVYEDPICPYCGVFTLYTSEEVGALSDDGEIALHYHPLSYFDEYSADTHYSTRAASAMATIAEYDPEHFWVFIEEVFANQPPEGGPGLTNDEIADIARKVDVSEEAIVKIADGEFTRWVASATEQASKDGVTETPMFLIGGVQFTQWVDYEGQPTTGSITAAVAYVKEHGAAALADYLATPIDPEPTPSV